MADDRYFEPDIELLSRLELDVLQWDRLRDLLPVVYDRSALIRRRWESVGVHPRDITSLADFCAKAPFMTKDDVRDFRDETNDPFGGLLCVPRSELTAIMSSSGTSGDPTFFAERFERWSPLQTGRVRDLWEHGLRPGDAAIPAPNAIRGASAHDIRLLGAVPVMVNSGSGNWRRVLTAIERYDVRYVVMLGPIMSEINTLSDELDMRRALAPLKFASFAGEPLGSRMQAKIRTEWGTALAMWTSAGDTGTAWECREHNGYHLWEDTVFPECLRPDGSEPVPDGEVGELVVTDLDNAVAPLVRYRSGDLVRMTHTRCACGRSHARIWPLGRIADLTKVGGKPVTPIEIWEVIEREDETRSALFQIVRSAPDCDELRIRIGYAPDRTADIGDLRERIMFGVEKSVGIVPTLEMVEEQEIVSQTSSVAKIPRIVSR